MRYALSITSFLKAPQVLLVAAGVLLVGLGFAIESSPTGGTPSSKIVVVRQDGFYPKEITIQKGDTVTFVTELPEEFWPASDPHPVHTNFPTFDSKRPIASDSSWSFTFQELGVHYYHNHLDSGMRGKIVVLEAGSGEIGEVQENCEEFEESAFDACTYRKVERLAKEEGVDAAFDLFKETYASGANLVCHWTAHLIGEVAFEEYQKGNLFDITKETSYCGYGFYHGFMELLLREDPDPDLAISFCEDVKAVLGEEGGDNCYHGIGHGFTEDPPPMWTWGDGMAMAKPGLEVCERLLAGAGSYKWETCATGVFTVVAGFHYEDKYGLSVDDERDPFRFCREEVPERYQTACLGEFAPKLDKVLSWDVTRIPGVVAGIVDDRGREYAIRAIVGGMFQRDITDEAKYGKYVTGCRTFPSGHDREACLRGAVWGLWLHGVPEEQYRRILIFCGLEELTAEERSLCYEVAFERFNAFYDTVKLQGICKGVPIMWRDSCLVSSGPRT